jgi:MFS family permease
MHIHGFNDSFKNLTFTSLAHFANDGIFFFIPLIADILATRAEVVPSVLTAMFLVFYGSSSVLSMYVGHIADRTGRPGPLIGVGTMMMSFAMVGYFLTLSYTTGMLFVVSMLASAFLAGFGSAFYHPLGASILQSSFNDEQRGRVLGINGAVGSVGRALYPSLFFFAAIFLSTYASLAFLGLVGVAISAAIMQGFKSKPERIAEHSPPKPVTRPRDALTVGVVLLTTVSFVRSVATSGIISWIPIYISNEKGLGISGALGLALTIMYGTAIVGQPLLGWLLDRFDRRVILAITSAGAGLTISGYLLIRSASLELVLLALFGLFTFAAFPLLFSLSSIYVSKESSSLGNALIWGLGTGGGNVLGPLATGMIVLGNYARLGLAFEVMAIIALLSAIVTVLLPKAGAQKWNIAFLREP